LLIETILKKLEAEFSSLDHRIDSSNKSITIPSIVKEIGFVTIEEYLDYEVIVYIGNITHCHLGSYNEQCNEMQKANEVAEKVSIFLKQLFEDQIVFWKGKRSSGFYKLGNKPNSKSWFGKQHAEWVWSGQKHS
jgi:hypothetical protein